MADKLLSSIIRNAIVPSNAAILPPQAFIDNIARFFLGESDTLNVSNGNITFISTATGSPLDKAANIMSWDGIYGFDFSGNALSVSCVNAILAYLILLVGGSGTSSGTVLDLSGGTNAAPTGQGLVDAASLVSGEGWTVNTN